MAAPHHSEHFQNAALEFARKDFPKLSATMSVEEALNVIREHGVGERLIYFYVVDDSDRLAGVLPTRRLLAAAATVRLEDLMIRRVVALPQSATLLDACDLFVMHRFYALPVVDKDRHMLGVIDVGVLTDELLDIREPEADDTLFEALGFHVEQFRGASAGKAFRLRFPWLLATITSGTCAALLAGVFEATLAKTILLSFFLPLVLALAEAVSVQSMTLTLQALRANTPSWMWMIENARRELLTGLMIGAACGAVVLLIAWLWRGQLHVAAVIGGSIAGGLVIAAGAGLVIPSLLRAFKLDPKIAAGPLTLAVADLGAVLLYFVLGAWLL